MLRALVLSFLMLACGAALADEAGVKKLVEAKTKLKVQSVTRTPYGGLYEVYTDGKIWYTDEKASFMIHGVLIDTKTSKNVTEQRFRKLTALNVKDLPPRDQAIRRVKGDGKRLMYVFSDPMCPYCKKLEEELSRLNNVSIYLFLYPIETKFPGSTAIAKSIWCSSDRAKAWEDWMLHALRPSGRTDCANPVDGMDKFAARLNIEATPTIIFADGGVLRQYARAEDLDRLLNDTPAN